MTSSWFFILQLSRCKYSGTRDTLVIFVFRLSLRRKRRTGVGGDHECPSACQSVSDLEPSTKRVVGYSQNSLHEFFTKSRWPGASFVKIICVCHTLFNGVHEFLPVLSTMLLDLSGENRYKRSPLVSVEQVWILWESMLYTTNLIYCKT